MDTISSLITNINLRNQSILPTSPPTPPPSTSKTATQQPPNITTTTLLADIPFSTSINQLHTFSTDLSAFLSHYDELQTHINFINSSIDSKLPRHLVEKTVCPNLSALTNVRLLETDCDRTITASSEVSLSERNPKVSDSASFSHNYGEIDASNKLEVVDVLKNCEETAVLKKVEEIDVLMEHVETDALKKPEETVAETFVDQAIKNVLQAIVSEENPKESESDCERNYESATADFSRNFEEFDASKKLEVVDVSKNCGEIDVSENFVEIDSSKKREESDVLKNVEEFDVLKKHVETFGDQSITAVPEAVVLEQKPNGTTTSGKRSHEINVRTPESLEETSISRSPEETYTAKKHGKTGTLKKGKENGTLNKFVRKLHFLCKNMSYKGLRWHVASYYSEPINLREEIAKALKLAKDPAKLVLNSTGRFFEQDSRAFCKDSGKEENTGRLASVLILECFVMISSDDGIEIEKSDRECAAKDAVIWRKRMILEGGFGHMDEVDARGLLLLISGFGIQDHVFKIQDIVDLIRASNVKGISTALRHSVFLMPKILDVISLMVKNNLEIEAVDIAYTFGLEDTCNSQNILMTYLHNKVKDIQNDPPFQTLEAMKQQLLDLKSVKQCLESHKVDPSTLLPDFKINEKIQILEKEVNESKLIQKRKSLENPIHQEAKCACFGHENMPHHHEPVDNYGIVLEQTPSESASDWEWRHESATMPDSTDFSHNNEKNDTLKNLEVVDVSKNSEEIYVSENPVAIDTTKTLEEFDVLKKHEEFDTLMKHSETDTLKKQEEIVTETFGDQTIGVVSGRNPNGMATNGEQSREIVTATESLEEINVSNKPEETDVLKKPKELDTSMIPEETVPETSVVSVLQSFCESMSPRQLRRHVATHFSKMINLREEIAKSLKLAKDPAQLVQSSIGRFFVSRSTTFRDYNQKLSRMVAVLILECFVMISSDGIEIAKSDREYTAKDAVIWRKRMIREGGFGKTDMVDARGLLLLISGFGIQDHVFKIQDIMDLIRASNWKGISAALRRSAFLMPKIPDVISLMVKNNLEIEAVDMAYTFGLEDVYNPQNILTTYLNNKIKDIQNDSPFQKLEAMKSVKQCLESHNVDPSKLLPDFKINEAIQNLEKEVSESKLIQKRKSLENSIHQEAKRACFGHEIIEESIVSNKPEEIDIDNLMKSEQTKETVVLKKPEELVTSINSEEIDTSKKPEETALETSCGQTTTVVPEAIVSEPNQSHEHVRTPENHEDIDVSKNPEVINVSKKLEQTDSLNKPEEIDILKKPEQTDICQKPEELGTSISPEEIDTWKKPEEPVPETSCDQTTHAVLEAIVSEQNPNSLEQIDASKNHSVIDISMKPEQTVILNKPEEIDILKKHEPDDICKNPEETAVIKKHGEIDTSMIPEETDTLKNREEIDASKTLEEVDTSMIPEEVNTSKRPEETVPEISCDQTTPAVPEAIVSEQNKSLVCVLQSLCQSMSAKKLKRHVVAHFTEMINLREEIAKTLKLAKDPAKLVLCSIGRFFVSNSRFFRWTKENVGRRAAVSILECFVMISSDGIEIAKEDRECAEAFAVEWRNRMIKEGGFGKTDEVDARGLLLLISGFGIQDHVFKVPDIMDLIRASNWKGISTALCRSAFLIPKIPWVVCLMKKNNLVVEAVDIAYTFGLEDMCHTWDILTEYLNNKIKDFQNSSSSQMKEAVEQQLFDLKSVKQCLESHNVDPSMLLPNSKLNEKIQNLEKEVNEWELIEKRKSLQNLIQQETKRACFGHENTSINSEENCTCEEMDSSKKRSETDTSKNPVPETSYDETITAVPEAIVSEQNPNRMASNREQSDENVRTPESLDETDVLKKPEQTDICKNTEVTVVLKKPQEPDTPMIPEEIDTSKKPEETVPETSCDQTTPVVPEPIVTKQNPNRTAANCKQSHENVTEKSVISELESLCESMRSKELKWHVAANLSEMINLRKEIAKTLKLAKDPAKLVLNSIGAFYVQNRKTFLQNKQDLGRKAAVLILEWFVMISGDGIKIAKSDEVFALQAAVAWRNRMIIEGGFGKTDEVDARGLLLLISGFGIQDHVFEIQDIVDLIRASNVKEISTALRRSIFLVPKIPEVIHLMVKNNLEIEAADIAYTFGLEDKCHPLSILATFLRNRIRNIPSGSFVHMLEEMKQQLFDLKSVKQCLESHNIDPSVPFPDFKINEKIQNLEKELNEEKPIQKRKSLDGPIYQEAKRACFGHENMPRHQSPVDHYGMNLYHQSTQLSPGYFDPGRDLHNSYISNYTPSSVYNTPVMRETITSPVPNGPAAGGFTGSYGHMHHSTNVQPYGWHEPYVQHYSRHGQPYDSQPYGRGRPWERGPPEPFQPSNPSGGFQRSSDLYSFADKVAKKYLR